MLILQVAAAVLMLLGSALIFHALVEIDRPFRSRSPRIDPRALARFQRAEADAAESQLPRAA